MDTQTIYGITAAASFSVAAALAFALHRATESLQSAKAQMTRQDNWITQDAKIIARIIDANKGLCDELATLRDMRARRLASIRKYANKRKAK